MDRIFSSIVSQIELNGLILKKGTMVDATILSSENKPLSKEKRQELQANPSAQIDTDALASHIQSQSKSVLSVV